MTQVTDSHTDDHTGHAGHDDHEHHGPPHLAHHFETPEQQLSSAKLGMWVFLATEILMFGGLFCAYSVWRGNHPEVFAYAHTALNKDFGFINTIFLITSSFTMAWAVRTAQLGRTKATFILMGLTLLGGCGFLVVKTFEYKAKWDHHLFVGDLNEHHPDYVAPAEAAHGEADGDHGAVDEHATIEQTAADHGAADHGTSDASVEVAGETTGETAGEIVGGAERTSIALAPDGPAGVVADWMVAPVIAGETADAGHADDHAADGTDEHGAHGEAAADAGHADAHGGGHGDGHSVSKEIVPLKDRQKIHQFFQIYFLMTGLHTFHVLVGMGVIAWLMFCKVPKGIFGPGYYTPIDLVGLYWHLVDLIWIFLFPLLYLIH